MIGDEPWSESCQALLKIALDAAHEAVETIPNVSRRIELTEGRDVKLAADRALHLSINARLALESPHPILSEEGEDLQAEKLQGIHWIVDPLDGSFNFAHRIPLSAVSIGLWNGSQPILGVVHDFNHGEVFTGVVGKGAWMNDEPILTSTTTDPMQASFCTGLPTESDFAPVRLQSFLERLAAFKKVRL